MTQSDKTNVLHELTSKWIASGLEPGNIALVHSSISRLLRRSRRQGIRLEPDDILASLRQAVGDTGTLLFPLFNFGFAQGEPFDIRSTPSAMGVLTEAARCHPEAVRTGHPIYSFAVLGPLSERFKGIENFSGYGPDSPFAILKELGGKIGVLDLPDQNSMTFYHHVEEMEHVPYRHYKEFSGLCTDRDGLQSERTFSLFVRNLERGVVTDVDPMGERLWQLGLYSGDRPGEGFGLRMIYAQSLYDATVDVIRSGQALGMLYSIEST